jgi:translation initiation factor 2 subunit 1
MSKPEEINPKDRYPEVGEYVIATVQDIFKQGSFVSLDEYDDKKGMLHLSEISLKWVRNIRDYVKEGQKVVLVVLGVNPSRGHIDLSLRRVVDAKRKDKLQQIKQHQRSEKIMSLLSTELSVPVKDLEVKIGDKLRSDYKSLYGGLEAISADNGVADKLGLDAKTKNALVELVKKSIKPPFVDITGYVEFKSYEPNGVTIIKEALKKIENYTVEFGSKIEVSYISPPVYRIKVTSREYKSAEKILKSAADEGIEQMKKHASRGEFFRNMEDIKKPE